LFRLAEKVREDPRLEHAATIYPIRYRLPVPILDLASGGSFTGISADEQHARYCGNRDAGRRDNVLDSRCRAASGADYRGTTGRVGIAAIEEHVASALRRFLAGDHLDAAPGCRGPGDNTKDPALRQMRGSGPDQFFADAWVNAVSQ
jgi:hypothetical protein